MPRYLHLFEGGDAFDDFDDAYYGNDYHEPWVSYTREDPGDPYARVNYNKPPEICLAGDDVVFTHPVSDDSGSTATNTRVICTTLTTQAEFQAALQRGSIKAYSYGIRGGFSFDLRARNWGEFTASTEPYPGYMFYGVAIGFEQEEGGLYIEWNWSTPV